MCLICALSLYLAQKLLRKVKIPQVCKNRKKIVVANAKMCSDVAEHDRNRRIRVFISISDSFATLTCEISSWTQEEELQIYKQLGIILFTL